MKRAVASLLVALVAGCAATGGHQLDVDLRTDFVPGTDFAQIVVALGGHTVAMLNATTVRGNLLDGARVLERSGLSGDVDVRVTLADARGGTIASRGARVHLTSDYALTILIARSCLGVICPRATDDSHATECSGGRCVAPDCVPSASSSCGTMCTSDLQCSAPVACATGACALGACLVEPVDSRCGSGMRCDVLRGCVVATVIPDGGLPDGSAPRCGDATCNGVETCTTCSGDCGACAPRCGDAICNGSETCSSCVGDCGACPRCGDATCNGSETCTTCSMDCGPCAPVCGDHACNGTESCTSCSADCGACPPSCGDLACSGGETCRTCPGDCGACPPVCGDMACNGADTCANCPVDCGPCAPYCGDMVCNGADTCGNCPGDCGVCPPVCGDGTCNGSEDCASCVADCGYGHEGFGENGDPCSAPPETWRCVFISSFGSYGSQVCRGGSWLTYVLNPQNCHDCCGAETTACYP